VFYVVTYKNNNFRVSRVGKLQPERFMWPTRSCSLQMF